MNISIVVPFPGAERETAVWADAERQIDFRRDPERAARCTAAFAALELKRHLERSLDSAAIRFDAGRTAADLTIELRIADHASKSTDFSLEPGAAGLVIAGAGRTGLLYGAYEFLRLQGWRWFAPGKKGEIAPAKTKELNLPKSALRHSASLGLGRGFDFEGVSKESAELLLWMARNRLNVSGYRWATGPLGEKLGMSPKIGGHIFEAILNPDRMLPSGQTLWEEHPEWYGLPADGARRKEQALRTQFCVARADLLEFLGAELLACLAGDWKDAERIDVWGFDTWGSTCACAGCRALGNSTDQILHFMAGLRDFLNRTRRAGRLDHDVRLVMCSYEGTATLGGPSRPIPRALLDASDYITFYPINRCYAHDLADDACPDNAVYHAALASWFRAPPNIPVTIGEYYNVSKFEDLPLLFTTRLARDLPRYHALGARGITYMHLPMVNWGMRTLTQLLYAQLAWNIATDVPAFLEEYFTLWYGPYARPMRKIYETAWLLIAQWRNWSGKSVLSQLQAWDGARPAQPLTANAHFGAEQDIAAAGRHSVALLQKALRALDRIRRQERNTGAGPAGAGGAAAVNPVEARRRENQKTYEIRLGEDRRLLLYGLDVMTVMTELTAYHQALHANDPAAAESAWKKIERTAEALDSYYIPIGYEHSGAGLESLDALTRSQVRDLLRRCRAQRRKGNP
jgi:hypothetical protein